MKNERKIVLCDIDHVVSNAFHRDHMIGTTSWDEYHAAAVDDAPVPDAVALINAMAAGDLAVWGFTARPGKWYAATMKWLLDHGVAVDVGLLRSRSDVEPNRHSEILRPNCPSDIWSDRYGI